MKTVSEYNDSNFDVWVGSDEKRTLVEAFAKVNGGIRHLVCNYEPELADKIKSHGMSYALERIKNDTIKDGVFSERPYKLAQSCDGSINECALALFFNWCKSQKTDPDHLYKTAYPEREEKYCPAWKEATSFAEWQGVEYPSLWDEKSVDGMLESLTEINYHSLREEIEKHLEKEKLSSKSILQDFQGKEKINNSRNEVKFENKDGKLFINGQEVIKGWESFSGWYWFATEMAYKQTSVLPDGREIPNDQMYYGFVQGNFEEWGYFSKSELESLRNNVWEIKKNDLPYAGRRNLNKETVSNEKEQMLFKDFPQGNSAALKQNNSKKIGFKI